MTITCMTLTYGRVERLNECLESFLRQDYADKRMVILNTCPQQVLLGQFPNVEIYNLAERPPNLGAARNLAVDRCPEGLICTLDDDDLALPHYLSVYARELVDHPKAEWVWIDKMFYAEKWQIKKLSAGAMNTFAFTKEAWRKIGGYNPLNVGEDRDFVGRMCAASPGRYVKILPEDAGYIYCWANNVYHVSGLGDQGEKSAWERARRDLQQRFQRRQELVGRIELNPGWRQDYAKQAASFVARTRPPSTPETKPVAGNKLCIVLLGRYGDIINILPVAKLISERHGKPYFIVSRQFADVLDGVSYVNPVPVDLNFDAINDAIDFAHRNYDIVLNAQIYGKNFKSERSTPAFNVESWRQIGFGSRFSDFTLSPVFDRRDRDQEQSICSKLGDKPLLLFKLTGGISSPFKHAQRMIQQLTARFSGRFSLVDLSRLRCDRIYHLLGVMDKAAALLTIDTSILHLATGSTVPVVVLTNSAPWLASLPRFFCAKFSYTEAEKNPESVLEALEGAIQTGPRPLLFTVSLLPPKRNLFHAVERHFTLNDKRRQTATVSWEQLYTQGVFPCHYFKYARTAKAICDPRELPYLKDVLKNAMNQASDADIIMFTNDDNVLHPNLPGYLRYHVSVHGPCSARRRELREPIPDLSQPPSVLATKGVDHAGRDLFAFTKQWLVEKWDEIPDFILGASDWDWCIAAMIRVHHGITTTRKNIEQAILPAEIPDGYVLHQFHPPRWMAPHNNLVAASQRHNRRLFSEWAAVNLPTLAFDKDNRI
jgi:glycosyltransferase involved in cell wall biosynthesis